MKFTLRDLFWVLLAVALVVGWFVDRRDQAAQYRAKAEQHRVELNQAAARYTSMYQALMGTVKELDAKVAKLQGPLEE